ncbi:MAG: hydroxyacid dehydrogenase [Hyphomicrobiaceae bacterium]|nr:hydroxyacid dehydrogenase [Hyphomicrobiaceae bacterium]
MSTNKKRIMVSDSMSAAGWEILASRDDVEGVKFPYMIGRDEFQALLRAQNGVHGMILGMTRIADAELDAAQGLQVIARTGVGYDAIDVPALSKRRIPLMVVGTANSPSVAEQAMFMMLQLVKRGAELDALCKGGNWAQRLTYLPGDLFEKIVLIIGFGRIGTRTAKRCQAMDMRVLVHDPYVPAATISAAGCEPVTDLDAAVAQADFITLHCPKTQETTGLFDTARIARMKKTAFLVNTARGGLVDEAALHAALTSGVIAGAGLDVLDREPPDPANPLLKLPNVIISPHIAGVTKEAAARMAVQAVRNVLSVFDGAPVRDNVVNPEIYG